MHNRFLVVVRMYIVYRQLDEFFRWMKDTRAAVLVHIQRTACVR